MLPRRKAVLASTLIAFLGGCSRRLSEGFVQRRSCSARAFAQRKQVGWRAEADWIRIWKKGRRGGPTQFAWHKPASVLETRFNGRAHAAEFFSLDVSIRAILFAGNFTKTAIGRPGRDATPTRLADDDSLNTGSLRTDVRTCVSPGGAKRRIYSVCHRIHRTVKLHAYFSYYAHVAIG